jgi:hypothetical protein
MGCYLLHGVRIALNTGARLCRRAKLLDDCADLLLELAQLRDVGVVCGSDQDEACQVGISMLALLVGGSSRKLTVKARDLGGVNHGWCLVKSARRSLEAGEVRPAVDVLEGINSQTRFLQRHGRQISASGCCLLSESQV